MFHRRGLTLCQARSGCFAHMSFHRPWAFEPVLGGSRDGRTMGLSGILALMEGPWGLGTPCLQGLRQEGREAGLG